MKKYIDLHTHLLPGVDDGAKSTRVSLNCFEKAVALGFETIVLTPHYLSGASFGYDENLEEFRKLKKKVSKKRLKINLILANEVMLDEKVVANLEGEKIVTINKSKYILVELPMYGENNIQNMLYKIIEYGLVPIVAHPERNEYFQSDLNRISELKKMGVVFQVNGASLLGYYGKKAQEVANYMIKNNLLHVIASDSHGEYDYMEKVLDYLNKKNSKKFVDEMLMSNPKKIINNELIK